MSLCGARGCPGSAAGAAPVSHVRRSGSGSVRPPPAATARAHRGRCMQRRARAAKETAILPSAGMASAGWLESGDVSMSREHRVQSHQFGSGSVILLCCDRLSHRLPRAVSM